MIKIREAKLSDLDFIISSIYKLRLYENKLNPKINTKMILEEGYRSQIKEEIDNKSCLILILEDNNENAGILIWNILKRWVVYDYKLFSELRYLYISDKFRRKWYAEKLSNEFFKWAKDRGSDRVVLTGVRRNEWALNFYKKIWFEHMEFSLGKNL